MLVCNINELRNFAVTKQRCLAQPNNAV